MFVCVCVCVCVCELLPEEKAKGYQIFCGGILGSRGHRYLFFQNWPPPWSIRAVLGGFFSEGEGRGRD